MVNKLSMKAKFMHLENQEKIIPQQDEEDKIIICETQKKSLENMQNVEEIHKVAEHSEKESADEEEHKDVVIIEPERLSSPSKKPKSKTLDEDEWGMINKDTLQNEQLHRRLSMTGEIKHITYIEAWSVVKETDLTNQLILLKKSE
jgi:hypothetical protein